MAELTYATPAPTTRCKHQIRNEPGHVEYSVKSRIRIICCAGPINGF